MMTETRMDVQAECLDAEPAKPTKLPLRAEALLRLIKEKVGKNKSCWHRQELLAGELGVSVRRLQELLVLLVDANLLAIRRTGRTNHYIPIDGSIGAEKCASEARKSAHQRRGKVRIRGAEKCASEARFSAPLGVAPLDELEFKEGERKEAAPPSIAAQAQPECQEHPQVEARLRQIQEFETSPERAKVEAAIQTDFPILASEPVAFSRACVDLFLDDQRERPFLDFKRDFMRRVPGCPKDGSFIDDWEKPFAKLGATPEELAMALESYIGDERRDWRDSQGKPTWEGRFAKDALRHLIGYIHKRRKAMRHLDASRHEASKPAVVPKEPARPLLVDGDDAAKVAAKLRELIGPGRFELWFGEGKGARFERGSSGVVLRVRNEMLKGELRTRFRVELRQALAEVLGDGVPFEIVVGVSEEAAKQ